MGKSRSQRQEPRWRRERVPAGSGGSQGQCWTRCPGVSPVSLFGEWGRWRGLQGEWLGKEKQSTRGFRNCPFTSCGVGAGPRAQLVPSSGHPSPAGDAELRSKLAPRPAVPWGEAGGLPEPGG